MRLGTALATLTLMLAPALGTVAADTLGGTRAGGTVTVDDSVTSTLEAMAMTLTSTPTLTLGRGATLETLTLAIALRTLDSRL